MAGVPAPASVEASAPARYEHPRDEHPRDGQARSDSAGGRHDSSSPATSPPTGGREARAPFHLSPPRPEPRTGILPLGEAAHSLYAPAAPGPASPTSMEPLNGALSIGESAGLHGLAGPDEQGCPAASSVLRSSIA